jgi:hypothetical protein
MRHSIAAVPGLMEAVAAKAGAACDLRFEPRHVDRLALPADLPEQ